MKHVKFFVRGASRYIEPHYMLLSQLPAELAQLEQIARTAMAQAKASHAVYAVKHYDQSGEIERVDFYDPPVCLNDADFYERTEAEAKSYPGCMIYAVHAHT